MVQKWASERTGGRLGEVADWWRLHRLQDMVGAIAGADNVVSAGALVYWMVIKVKAIFKYDDALDPFCTYIGAGLKLGALLGGAFSHSGPDRPNFGTEAISAGRTLGASGQPTCAGVLIAWECAGGNDSAAEGRMNDRG